MRLKLLAGILDGDGHLSHNGFEVCTKFSSLSKDLEFLVRSLGLNFYQSIKKVRIDTLAKAKKPPITKKGI